jgi:hypothetical protein
VALILAALATLSAAIFAGGALYVSLVEHPARMQAGVAVAVAEFVPSYRRAAPWQATAAAVAFVAACLAALVTARWVWALGGVAVGAAIPFTLVAIMPTNRRLLDGGALPSAEAARLLTRWGRLHWVRSGLGVAGLLALVLTGLTR